MILNRITKISKIISISWSISLFPIVWYFHRLYLAATEKIANATFVAARLTSMSVFWEHPIFGSLIFLSLFIQFMSICLSFYILFNIKKMPSEDREKCIKLSLMHLFIAGFFSTWLVNFENKWVKKIVNKIRTKLDSGRLVYFRKFKSFQQFMVVPFFILPLISVYALTKLSEEAFEDNKNIYEDAFVSTDPSKPNFIEWFHDGLDNEIFSQTVSDKSQFDDFYAYTKVITESYSTSNSLKGMYGGTEHATWTDTNYYRTTLFKRHLFVGEDNSNIAIIGPQPFIDSNTTGGYHATWSGDAKYLSETLGDVNVLGWKEARDKLYEKEGPSKYSPDFITQYYAFDTLKTQENVSPLRMYINDHYSHFPYTTSPNGGLNVLPGIIEDGYYSFGKSMEFLIEKLKSIKNPDTGLSAYDNTTIMVYGDHGRHNSITLSENESGYTGKNRSMILVKPINTSNDGISYNNERWFSSAYYPMVMNEIVYRPSNVIDFMNSNRNFDEKLYLPTLVGDKFMLSTFDDDDINIVYTDDETNGWVPNDHLNEVFQQMVNEVRWYYE